MAAESRRVPRTGTWPSDGSCTTALPYTSDYCSVYTVYASGSCRSWRAAYARLRQFLRTVPSNVVYPLTSTGCSSHASNKGSCVFSKYAALARFLHNPRRTRPATQQTVYVFDSYEIRVPRTRLIETYDGFVLPHVTCTRY